MKLIFVFVGFVDKTQVCLFVRNIGTQKVVICVIGDQILRVDDPVGLTLSGKQRYSFSFHNRIEILK